MSYVQKVLQPGETVLYEAKLSWTVFAPGLALLVLAAIAGIACLLWPDYRLGFGLVAAILAVVGLLSLAGAWFTQWTTEIAVTDRRVIHKRGLIWRQTVEMNVTKVETVDVDQSIVGRIFDYGTVTLKGTGSTLAAIKAIDAPIKFRSAVTAH